MQIRGHRSGVVSSPGRSRDSERPSPRVRRQGIAQGEASLLERLLQRRFAQIPGWVEERLEKASREELESWADRVIEAKALEEVFA